MSTPTLDFDWPTPPAGPLMVQTMALIEQWAAREGWTQLHQTRAAALLLTAERIDSAPGYKFADTMSEWRSQLAELEATPLEADETGDVEYDVVLLPSAQPRGLPHAS